MVASDAVKVSTNAALLTYEAVMTMAGATVSPAAVVVVKLSVVLVLIPA